MACATGISGHGRVERLTRGIFHRSAVFRVAGAQRMRPAPWHEGAVQELAIADFHAGESALLATAIHAGSDMRPSLVVQCLLSAGERLREEDPYTDSWVDIADNRIIGLRSRFEVDLNRPPEKAVYQRPEDAWGLNVWKQPLPAEELAASLRDHTEFFNATEKLMAHLLERHARVVVYDLHSYNHRRGEDHASGDPQANPEINIGTGNVLPVWVPVVDALVTDLSVPDETDHTWDVRKNVRFRGGYFGQWLTEQFGERVCPLAIEVKKVFMDEWTGIPDPAMIERIHGLLQRSVPAVMHATHALAKP